jgi:thiopurine S-methyltransferase
MDSEKEKDNDESTRETLKPWSDRWKNKRTGFHLKEVNPILVKYSSDLLQMLPSKRKTCEASGDEETSASASPIKVFVPLCGKAVDMAYLATAAIASASASASATTSVTTTTTATTTTPSVTTTTETASFSSVQVVGLEGIRVALEEFIEEHPYLNISRDAIPRSNAIPFERFVSSDNGVVSLWKGDYFDLAAANEQETQTQPSSSSSSSSSSTTSIIGTFGAIYDRASIVAIEPDRREDYVRILDQLLEPGGRILMLALERVVENTNANAAAATKKGPPYSVPESTIRELFGNLGKHNENNNNNNNNNFGYSYTVELLQETDQLVENPKDRERYPDLDRLLETVYLIRKEVV